MENYIETLRNFEQQLGKIEEITEERWYEALECLPPEKWINCNKVEIFRMREYEIENITRHYMRHGKRYFSALYRTSASYSEISAAVLAA